MSTQVNSDNQHTETSSLKHGQFKVQCYNEANELQEYIVNPLTQEELADGWNLVLPRETKDSTIHHFSVYLSQLPPHLWSFLKIVYDQSGGEHYGTIRDNIYHYSIKSSKYDDDIKKLYKLVMQDYPCKDAVSKLHTHLEQQRVKGWVMIRAKKYLSA